MDLYRDIKSFYSESLGDLSVKDRLPNNHIVRQYICSSIAGLHLVSFYPFPPLKTVFEEQLFLLSDASHTSSLSTPLLDFSSTLDFGILIFNIEDLMPLEKIKNSLTEDETSTLVQNLLSSVALLHSLGRVHFNLRAEVILRNNSGDLKFLGFEDSLQLSESDLMMTGSFEFQKNQVKAPELSLKDFEVSWQADVWSLGCLIFELIFHFEPFQSTSDIKQGKFQEIDKAFQPLFGKIFSVDPLFRPSCENIKEMIKIKKEEFSRSLDAHAKMNLLTRDSNSAPSFQDLPEVIAEFDEEPELFFAKVQKSSVKKPFIALKALISVHSFCLFCKNKFNSKIVLKTLQSFGELLAVSCLNLEKSTKALIFDYLIILLEKFRLRKEFRVSFDWSNLDSQHLNNSQLISFQKQMIKLVDLILFQISPCKIFQTILELVLSELVTLSALTTFAKPLISPVEDFEKFRKDLQDLMPRIYCQYPLLDFPINSLIASARKSFESRSDSNELQMFTHSRSRSQTLDSESKSVENSKSHKSLSNHQQSFTESFLVFLPILEIPSIPDIQVIEKISNFGASADVFKGMLQGVPVAVKAMRKSLNPEDKNYLKEFLGELKVLTQINHENLVKYLGTYRYKEREAIVTEFCEGGALFSYMQNPDKLRLSPKQKVKIALDIAKGMEYLHSQNPVIIHRDLKSLNILLTQEITSTQDIPLAKIADFGISRTYKEGLMTKNAGTSYWMAPEVIDSGNYGPACDVYSFGIILWELIFQKLPYVGETRHAVLFEVKTHKRRPSLSSFPSNTPKMLESLMKQCWSQSPQERPSFKSIVSQLSIVYS